MDEKPGTSRYHRSLTRFVSHVTTPDNSSRSARRIVICALIFLAALGVRFLHWQDYQLSIGSDQSSLVGRYKQQAQRMLDGDGILYPRDYEQHSSSQLIVHPPGYSIFIAGVFGLVGKSDDKLVLAQVISDSAAAVLVFLIAAALLPQAASTLAGLLVAFSPHLAHHSLLLLPESLAVLPILIAAWLLIQAQKKPRLVSVLVAGALIGVSCWLRSNALLLAPFLALLLFMITERGLRSKHAIAFVCATIVVISPITVRNWIVFRHFVPLSLGSGLTMIEGIADYDKENRFGMPATDDEAGFKDMEWHNRPDYVGLWRPDGVERDRYRFARGVDVVRNNPVWFAGVMIRRAGSMLRYNDSLSQGWPGDTALASVVSAEPSFGHQLAVNNELIWSSPAAELLARGRPLSSQTECSVGEDGTTIKVAGDNSDFDDQFASAPITVEQNTDYVVSFPVRLMQGRMAAKVTNAERRITLGSTILQAPDDKQVGATKGGVGENEDGDIAVEPKVKASQPAIQDDQRMTNVLIPFATGSRREVLLVVSNNGQTPARSQALLGKAELYELGQTPQQWSRFVRPAVRGIQRNLYTTSHMLPLIGIGVILLAVARRWRPLLILLAVPAYYLLVQSALHTEYRYILAIHYFLLVMAAVTFYCLGSAIAQATKRTARRLGAPRAE